MDDHAASHVLAFLASGLLFVAGVGTLLAATQGASDDSAATSSRAAASFEVSADSLLDVLASQGLTAAGQPWRPAAPPSAGAPDLAAESLGRTGLGGDGGLSWAKLQYLAQAPQEANGTDGLVSYGEAQASLGHPDVDFHLSIRPAPAWEARHAPVRPGVAYVGAAQRDPGPASLRLCTVLLDGSGQPIRGEALAGATFSILPRAAPPPFTAAADVPATLHATPLRLDTDLLLGDGILDARCTAYPGLPLGDYFYDVAPDPPATGPWLATLYNDLHTGAFSTLQDLYAYSPQLFNGDPGDDGGRQTNSDGHIVLSEARPERTLVVAHRLQATTGEASAIRAAAHPLAADAAREATLLALAAPSFCLFHAGEAASPLQPTPAPGAACGTGAVPEGDVLAGLPAVLDALLPATLARVGTLVVGSGASFDPPAGPALAAFGSWLAGGGRLVLLGSDAAPFGWAAPAWDAGLAASPGGLSIADAGHALLNGPNRLDPAAYAAPATAWVAGPASLSPLEAVVQDGVGQALLAASRSGALGGGRVVASAWQPASLLGSPGPAQDEAAVMLLENLLAWGAGELRLDYGPDVPPDRNAMSASRITTVRHPEWGDVPVTVTLHLFTAT